MQETARTAPKLCMETGSAWTPPPVAQLEAEHVQLLLHSIDHFSEHADLGAQLVLSWQRRLAQCKGQLKHAGDEAAKQARQVSVRRTMLSMLQRPVAETARCARNWVQKTESGHERMHLLDSENRELNLQVLAWRKKTAVLRLKMSSCEEAVRDISANRQAVREEVVQLVNENEGLKQRICSLKQDMQLMLSQLQYQQDEAKLHKVRMRAHADAKCSALRDGRQLPVQL